MLPPLDFRAFLEASPHASALLDAQLRIEALNPEYVRQSGRAASALLGRELCQVFVCTPGSAHDGGTLLSLSARRARDTGQADTVPLLRFPADDQAPHAAFSEDYWSVTHTPVRDAAGAVAWIVQQALRTAIGDALPQLTDASAQRCEATQAVLQTNRALFGERLRLTRLFEQAPGFMCYLGGRDLVFELANRAYYRLMGQGQVIGRPARQVFRGEAGTAVLARLDEACATGRPVLGRDAPLRVRRRPGRRMTVYVDYVIQPVLDGQGEVTGVFVQGHDVTDKKRALDALRRERSDLAGRVSQTRRALRDSEAERRQAEQALAQSQKMEAVGRLTGGVAHDFNNVLQIIGGNLELLRSDWSHADLRAHCRLDAAVDAVRRGAHLASQLLSFARRQPLQAVPLDLGALVARLEPLMRRILGETVTYRVDVPAQLWHTRADGNHLENVLLNLAINARDAMPDGGSLSVSLRNAHLDRNDIEGWPDAVPGEHVCIAMRDTGCGMSEAVRQRAFEPFFTTKPEGRGTGLGLSMTYGFVRQSGGQVRIDSVPGRGTTIALYLPRCVQAPAAAPREQAAEVLGGRESVLVVEDDEAVRDTAVEMLRGLGYRVASADCGESALALLAAGQHFDLLFSDVMMPGRVDTRALIEAVRAGQTPAAVLLTSGHTQETLDPAVAGAGQLALLNKPYRRDELARQVRAALAQGGRRRVQRVLLVEDDPNAREASAALLEALGHEVASVGSGGEALRHLDGAQHWDVLLTDYQLPDFDGVRLMQLAAERRPGLRLVCASGAPPETLVGADAPAVSFLTKPFDLEGLDRVLRGV